MGHLLERKALLVTVVLTRLPGTSNAAWQTTQRNIRSNRWEWWSARMCFEVGYLCPLVSICLADNGQECRILFFQQVPVSLRTGSGIRSCHLTVCLPLII